MQRPLFIGALLGSSLAACAAQAPRPAASESAPIPVATELARRHAFALTERLSGTVRGRATATLTSKTVGYVRAVRVRSGDVVTEGQPLAELEATEVQAGVARARAALSTALASQAEAESTLQAASAAATLAKSTEERATSLLGSGAIPQAEFDRAQAGARSATAEESRARARLATMRSEIDQARAALGEVTALLGYAKIVAPFAGRVLERLVDPGALAAPGTPLLVIADDERLRVEAAVPESHGAELRLGLPVSVELDGVTAPVAASVGEIVPSVDVTSRAFLVKVDLPASLPEGAGRPRPGSFARVLLPTASETHLAVPVSAVTRFGALERVFVVDHGHAELRMVTTGEPQADFVPVLAGLSEGERVVRDPPPDLRDASLVTVAP